MNTENAYPMPRNETEEEATIRRLGQISQSVGRLLALPSVSVDIAPTLRLVRAADRALYEALSLVDPGLSS